VREYTHRSHQHERRSSPVIGNSLQTSSPPTRLLCVECQRPWLDGAQRWRLKITDDEPAETVPYCPDCATREFGPAHA